MTKPTNEYGYIPIEDKNKETGIKTTYIGTRKVRDIDTGEVIELEYLEKKVSHNLKKGWRRVYLEQFMEVLTGLYASSKKIDVVEFILSNLNSENQLTLTQSYIAEKTGISFPIINETFKYLVKIDFMKKIGTAYVVNPKYVCAFGSD
ncbi:hypothetical protein H8435_001843, partial [Campylobacter jejuni]|nr:hypothetical protein [Campylobacter jejuni]